MASFMICFVGDGERNKYCDCGDQLSGVLNFMSWLANGKTFVRILLLGAHCLLVFSVSSMNEYVITIKQKLPFSTHLSHSKTGNSPFTAISLIMPTFSFPQNKVLFGFFFFFF